MNPAQLLTHFDRISEAPDAIPRLRLLILDLAVRGILVEQDPNDEPAAELIKRIQAEKVRLVKEGKIRNQDPWELNGETEIPFKVPSTWEWVPATFPAYPISDMGKKVQMKDVLESGEFPVVDQGKVFIRGYCNDQSKVIRVESSLVLFGDHTRETKLIEFDFIVGADGVKLLQPICLSADYYYLALRWLPLESRGYGRHYKLLKASLIPLPPIAEQNRIVAKVDELMALCDQLEAAQAKRESRRDRLVAASLQRLNNGADAQSFREYARFHLNNLPHLTIRPAHIQQLRQTILNLAVRGKLVPQDPSDEPATELLTRIQAERAGVVKKGKINKFETVSPSCNSSIPLELPLGWTLANLESLCISVTDGDHLPPPKTEAGIPFLVIGNVRNQTLYFLGCRYVSEEYYSALDTIRRPQKGDILYTLVGSYGIPIMITDDRPFCVQRHIGILRPSQAMNAAFLCHVMKSQWVFNQATEYATGIAQKTVPLGGLRKILIPLPPLAEQQRIVAKVDQLMKLCDELESNLTNSHSISEKHINAIINQVLDKAS